MKPKFSRYMKYSSLGFEMISYILIGYFVGGWIDGYFETARPYWTAVMILLLLVAAFYRLIVQLNNDDKKND